MKSIRLLAAALVLCAGLSGEARSETLRLSEQQLDQVTAGQTIVVLSLGPPVGFVPLLALMMNDDGSVPGLGALSTLGEFDILDDLDAPNVAVVAMDAPTLSSVIAALLGDGPGVQAMATRTAISGQGVSQFMSGGGGDGSFFQSGGTQSVKVSP